MTIKLADSWTSISELSSLRRCERRWGLDYGSNIPKQKRSELKTGARLHELAEVYLKTGELPDATLDPLVELFTEMLPHLPHPKDPSVLVEPEQDMTPYGLPILLKPDIAKITGEFIWDLKTTEDIKEYGILTATDKDDDVQTVSYVYSIQLLTGARETTFRHVYAQKHRAMKFHEVNELREVGAPEADIQKQLKKAKRALVSVKCEKSDRTYTREMALERHHTLVLPLIKKRNLLLRESGPAREHDVRGSVLKTVRHPDTLKPNAGACGDFGGCRYKGTQFCVLTETDIVQACGPSNQNQTLSQGNNTMPSLFETSIPAVNGSNANGQPGPQLPQVQMPQPAQSVASLFNPQPQVQQQAQVQQQVPAQAAQSFQPTPEQIAAYFAAQTQQAQQGIAQQGQAQPQLAHSGAAQPLFTPAPVQAPLFPPAQPAQAPQAQAEAPAQTLFTQPAPAQSASFTPVTLVQGIAQVQAATSASNAEVRAALHVLADALANLLGR